MPYKIRKARGKDLYWVVDDAGRHFSKEPIPYERALRQLRALWEHFTKNREDGD